ncbi:MAG: hypothetical protein AAAB13_20190, partial [Pseudomonas sp.]
MSMTKWTGQQLLALTLGSLLPLGAAQACGPEFPYRLLDDRSNALQELPEGNFAFEISRLGQSIPGLARAGSATLDPYWDDSSQQYLDARVAVEKQQLSAEQFALISQLRTLTDARQADSQGASLPAELRLYTAGAVAFTQQDMALAADYFRQVLALPAAERPLRSSWAAYSLGRSLSSLAVSALDDHLDDAAMIQRRQQLRDQARQAYQQTRTLSIGGFSDPLELGIASLGEEARLKLEENDWDSAIRLYASQSKLGSSTGYSSIRQLTSQLLAKPDAELLPLLATPQVQQLLVAQLFSRLGFYYDAQPSNKNLIHLLLRVDIARPENADRLAALAYQQGDYASAKRFSAQAGDSGLAWWLRAKLALRDGDKVAATQAYAKAAKAFPADEDW